MTMVLSSSILVVDDEQELATLFKEAIGRMGFDVYSFTSPLLALEYFKDNQEKFSLVITDLRMPELSGLELANWIRDVDKSINIFLITAFDTADIEENESYQSAKIDRILQKPIKLSLLKESIEETISN